MAGLSAEREVVYWDYRGHGDSERGRSGDYSMATQADDLRRVTEAVRGAGGAVPVHIAFSMGVTVLLELYRRHPEEVKAMVLVAGGADHPYAASPFFRLPGARPALRAWLRGVAPLVPRLSPATRRLSGSSAIFSMGRALGALNAAAPREELEHFFRTVGAMDLEAYWATVRALLEAHASDVLPRVRVPVLIVAPARDLLAPQRDLEQLRASIPSAEWVRLPHTGHAILLEAGDVVAERVRSFLHRLPE